MRFIDRLQHAWHSKDTLLCVGLDPDLARLPAHLRDEPDAMFRFLKDIVDATHDLVCCFKPQIAYFSAVSAEQQLQRIIAYIKSNYPDIPVILDAKRGDIGSTSAMYAVEAFTRYGADAVTINPYMGYDSAAPFLAHQDRGVVFLCRTSNDGAQDIQDLVVDGLPLYAHVARMISQQWNTHHNSLLVVGATWPHQMASLRALVGDMPFLVPGVGAQGGDVEALVNAGQTQDGTGLIISASRAILYASGGHDFAEAARRAALSLKQQINLYRHQRA